MATPLDIITAGLAAFLIGVNLAFIVEYWDGLTQWFSFKLGATTMLLLYVGLSVALGSPAQWRVAIGLGACIVDTMAIARVWLTFQRAKRHSSDLVVYQHPPV